MNKKDDSIKDKDWYQFCWNYFVLMSNQRMQLLHFYLSIELVLFGGVFALLTLKDRIIWAEYAVSILITLITILFKGLDLRSKTMIHKCEHIMEEIEIAYQSKLVAPGLIQHVNEWDNEAVFKMTYSKWLDSQFFVIGITGIVLLLLLYYKVV